MESLYLLVTLLCPLSMVGLMGWWMWSMRRTRPAAAERVRRSEDVAAIEAMRKQMAAGDETSTVAR